MPPFFIAGTAKGILRIGINMKIALITGAGSGMGRCFALYAKKFYRKTDMLWLIGRNEKKLKKTAACISMPCLCISADLSNDSGLEKVKNMLAKISPEIVLLVNSAGSGLMGGFRQMTVGESVSMCDINCRGLTAMTSLCLPYMHKGAGIINLASAAAFLPQPYFSVYSASKAYVYSFSRSLSRELKKDGIRVCAVCPGCVDTGFFDGAQKYEKLKPYKKVFMAKDRKVVKKALKDAAGGRGVSVYGIPMKLFYLLCKLIPSELILRILW